jgi:iron(III) transport system ATP-binding protein
MNPVGVDIENVELSFGATAVLKDITVSIEPGEFFALLGPSGSGKSTLLRLIAGFNQHSRGSVRIGGRDVTGIPPWKRDVGMVFQNYALWPHMTVEQNVAFGLEERRLPRETIRRKVAAVLELVDLGTLGQRRPGQLSGGQQQRVAIARTLAIEPQVLLLDEPLSNLDARLRVQTRQELVKLQRRLGLTTIFVTHDQEEALTTCHRIAVMDQGIIQQVGSPMELFDHPVNRFVARFVGSVNLFAGEFRREGGRLRFVSPKLGEVALPPGLEPPATGHDLAFRPHAVRFAGDGAAEPGDALRLEGAVEGSEFLGEFLRYEIRVGEALVTADVPHRRGHVPLAAGSPVGLSVPAAELRFVSA